MGRKEELLAIDDRTEAEQVELDALLEAENPDKKSADDEFAAAFDDALEGKPQIADEDPDKDNKLDEDLDENGKVKEDLDDGTVIDPKEKDTKPEAGLIKPPDKEDIDEPATNQDGETDWEAEYKKEQQKTKSWNGRIRKERERAEQAELKLKTLEKSTSDIDGDGTTSPEGDDTDDAAEAINEFTTEYPSLEKPIKAIAEKMAKKIIDAKLNELQPQLNDLTERANVEDSAVNEDHFSSIKVAHPDFEQIRDSGRLDAWIDKQESFVKYGFQKVIASGTADEIIDMFNRFKGVKATQSSTTNQREKVKAKAKQHMAVDGETGGPIDRKGKIDNDDFDGAWNEALTTK